MAEQSILHRILGTVDNLKRQAAGNVRDAVNEPSAFLDIVTENLADTNKKLASGDINTLLDAAFFGSIAPAKFLKAFPSFSGTTIKTAEGELQQVYHGTSKDVPFTSFAKNKRGNFVHPDRELASQYALDNESMGAVLDPYTMKIVHKNEASRVLPLYADVKSPYKMSEVEVEAYRKASNYAKFQRDIMAKATAKGHDAVIYPDGSIAVARPEQLQSSLTIPSKFLLEE